MVNKKVLSINILVEFVLFKIFSKPLHYLVVSKKI